MIKAAEIMNGSLFLKYFFSCLQYLIMRPHWGDTTYHTGTTLQNITPTGKTLLCNVYILLSDIDVLI